VPELQTPEVAAPPVMIAWPFLFCQYPIVSAPVGAGMRQTCTDAFAYCPVSVIAALFGYVRHADDGIGIVRA
jgi:hypothetical protein